MNFATMTVDELERLTYIEPGNLAAQRAYVQRCMDEVEALRGECERLEDENDQMQSQLDDVREEAAA